MSETFGSQISQISTLWVIELTDYCTDYNVVIQAQFLIQPDSRNEAQQDWAIAENASKDYYKSELFITWLEGTLADSSLDLRQIYRKLVLNS